MAITPGFNRVERSRKKIHNRFSGFYSVCQTVETVGRLFQPQHTQLKLGVNEIRDSYNSSLP